MKAWLLCLLLGSVGVAAAAEVDYQRDVKPLLAEKCGACHGALEQQAGLRLDAGVLIRQGSEEGPVIVVGNSSESRLIQRVMASDSDERMPPEGEGESLTAEQVSLLTAWINAGAKSPPDEAIPADPRDHWSYQTPQRPPLPEVNDPRWSHPIDAFIHDKHRQLGLQAVDLADRQTLLRRIYLDLIGLPPTRTQLQAFLDDESPDAWSRVVALLLESPQYGERWGRHWMDVWRYSDWDGYKEQLRGSQRHIWRWRDWIVQSLNEDKGYDRMIVEMLAGDEVAPGDGSVLPATGFLARNYHKSNRNIWLDATVEHTAKAFLGLTINCARCHDHKFDPVPQTAYYQFRAIFEPHNLRTDRLPGQPNVAKDGLPRAFDADLAAQTFVYLAGNEKQPDKEHPLKPALPAVLGGSFEVQSVQLPVVAYYPALTDFRVQEQLAAARREVAVTANETSSFDELRRATAKLRLQSLETRLAADRAKYEDDRGAGAERIAELASVAAAAEREFNLKQAELSLEQQKSGLRSAESSPEKDEKKKQAAIAKAKTGLAAAEKKLKAAREAATKTDAEYTPLGTEYPRTSSGRRLALARWITAPENPLTARVAVNHIWMRHFGSPLVENVFDFGLRSPRPAHADLLDWLAAELMENDWSMKHLHSLIVTSRTWRLASTVGRVRNPSSGAEERVGNTSYEIDQDNQFLWRMNVRRLDAEIIRDNVLAVSGQLDRTLGGADIDFRQGEQSRRRSLYLRHAYEKQMTMLVLFDAASPNECYRRSESIVPQQALALTNSSLSLGQSRRLARQLWEEVRKEDDPRTQFVGVAFRQVLARPPAEEELTACLQFLTEQAKTLADTSKLTTFLGGQAPSVEPAADPDQRALENLVHVLMNHNDFVTVR